MRGVTARQERRAGKSGSSPVRKKRERGAEASGKIRRAGARFLCERYGNEEKRKQNRHVGHKKSPDEIGAEIWGE